jgi:hypothetical protein
MAQLATNMLRIKVRLGRIRRLMRSWPKGLSALALAGGCLCVLGIQWAGAVETPRPTSGFNKEIRPLLEKYCWDCHGDGMEKGNVSFDSFKTDAEAVTNRDLWSRALKNTRAGLMPPAKKPRPSTEEQQKLEAWIKYDVFGIDAKNPDPGRVTIRRLNRVEYRNTIRDLMGFDFKADDEFPPDDTGYGFDNIGDVLTISPLLLEKYMQAAEVIVAGAVPSHPWVIPEKVVYESQSRGERSGEVFNLAREAGVSQKFNASHAGDYRVFIDLSLSGSFEFDPARSEVVLKIDGSERLKKEFGWDNKKLSFDFSEKWEAGEHELKLELKPVAQTNSTEKAVTETASSDQRRTFANLRMDSLRVQGPLDKQYWTRPKNFERFFTQDDPKKPAERRKYATQLLKGFATKAYRRPVDERTVQRLVSIAEQSYSKGKKTFEESIGRAMVGVLASPRFLFRVEETERPAEAGAARSGSERRGGGSREGGTPYLSVDEYSLASRLSYFLWSSMPDEELLQLAERGELRKNLDAQVKRMLADRKANQFVENFTGQWLQTRDVDGIDINVRAILFRDNPGERDFRRRRERAQELRDKRDNSKLTPEEERELAELQEGFRRRFANRPQVELDGELRRAMRRETEMAFGYIVREDRSVTELIESDYTFLNERLAKHYGLTNLNVTGLEMRRVALPEDSQRGGLLTHGSMLIVTSNPTRTSPVKRGLFLLENIIGAPPPPPPANVPDLEDSAKEITDHDPTLREVLEIHRGKPLCSSCHNRMDPLGLALENFNALGMWREKERGQPIETTGKLITGESFNNIKELEHIIVTQRRRDYYRCLAEKLLTYALGRGLEDYDVETVDRIVQQLEAENGRFSALLRGIVESSPFQKRRNSALLASGSQADVKGK